jgi:hypothetical protein
MAQPTELEALRKELAEERKARLEEKAARGALEARMDTLMQLASAKSEPERVAAIEKAALAAHRKEVKDEALAVAKALSKGKEKITHLRYVTGSWYQRKGVNYPPGTVLKIPITEEPANDWKAWKRPLITRPTAVDPDAEGTPMSEVRSSTSAIADLRRSEAAGDTIVASRGAPAPNVEDISEQPSAEEQATEPASTEPRASDTDVG